MDGAKVALAILSAALVYKLGKEAAYEEIREAFGLELEQGFEEGQRANAGLQ